MEPGDNGMMKTKVLLVRSVEFDKVSKSLTPLGELQVESLAETLGVKGFQPDCFRTAAYEADSWTTAYFLKEAFRGRSGPDVQTLRELSIPDTSLPRNKEIAGLITQYPNLPLSTYAGQPGYRALLSQSRLALREIRKHVSPDQHQQIIICSRHGHVLSSLALDWVSEMIFVGFKLCPAAHLPSYPIEAGDLCYAATEFALGPGQGLMFSYDASDPASRKVGSIQFINPEANIRS